MSDKPLSRSFSGDGRVGWFAYPSDGSHADRDDVPWQPPPPGAVIQLMGEDTVTVPLWSDQDGLMFSAPGDVIAGLRVSAELAADLETWGIGWHAHSGQPDHDAQAARLVRRLNEELDHRYQFVYRP